MESTSQPDLKKPLIVFLIVVVLGIWALNTLNTGNPWWFLPLQPNYQPSRIIIRDHGRAVTLRPGDAEYEPVAAALNEAFAEFANSSLIDIGLSEDTLERYHEEDLVLEIYYSEFIRFNTPVRMSNVNQLLFPVEGRHDGQGYLFMGRDGRWLAGAMRLANPEPILNVMRELGYQDGQ